MRRLRRRLERATRRRLSQVQATTAEAMQRASAMAGQLA
jgi:hypothetical protein